MIFHQVHAHHPSGGATQHVRPTWSPNVVAQRRVKRLFLPSHTDDDPISAERSLLAGRLRESLIEPLSLLLAQISVYEQTAADERQRMALAVLAGLTRQTLQNVRDLEAELDERALQHFGIEAALEMLAARIMRRSNLLIDVSLPHTQPILALPTARVLVQSAQDILSQAAGSARQARMRLAHDDQQVTLRISTDGSGTSDVALREALVRRIEYLHGSIDTSNDPRGGSLIEISIPLREISALTPREREVLVLLANGLRTRAIAEQLHTTQRTITFHLANIYAKLGAADRGEAIVIAHRDGLLAD